MRVTVGMGSCGIAAGADEVYEKLAESALIAGNETCRLQKVGCMGACHLEPIVEIDGRVFAKVDSNGVDEIIKLIDGQDNNASDYQIDSKSEQSGQLRIALRNCGIIDPESIDEYIERGGYKASERCTKELTPEQIIEEVKASQIAGRGGAGFPTWFKWNACRNSSSTQKYIICNADEGDPGAFMDRAILEGDPHSVIEGMIIGARAIGGESTAGNPDSSGCTNVEGVIYVRAEYPLAITRLSNALEQAREHGYLGKDFDIRIKAGAGAFVCGEETALIASLEGERGMPRLKPPFPAQKGYWQKPSNINNVETFANIPWIIQNGGEVFAKIGTENSKGTKVFALTGKIAKGGLAEVEMGKTIGDVVYGPGGGLPEGKKLKAVQLGGPSGGCIPKELINTEIDYKSLAATGAIMGSGGMVVMDETTCMVDMARYFLDFTCKESCGKCTHCRIGNKRLLEILERICDGKGKNDDIKLLEELGAGIKAGSLCALGQTAPNPVLTTIKYFRNEYEDHIRGKCTAGQCKALLIYSIIAEKCTGCTLCKRKCPNDAITGEVKKTHSIDMDKCIKCGQCADVCKFKAVEVK